MTSLFESAGGAADQPNLFGEGRFRHDGPATSQKAAQDPKNRIAWGTQKHQLLEEYRSADLTDEEAGERSGLLAKRAAYWMRCSDLRKAGLIEDAGITRISTHGAEVMVCRITTRGRQALMMSLEQHLKAEKAAS